mmetsp:Transcript_78120/g.181255  ORF Transcript_78120/g.181255 Transcript_78120/m.181255 type:complete len:95 (-) Transcript_78120:2103-2387(-)
MQIAHGQCPAAVLSAMAVAWDMGAACLQRFFRDMRAQCPCHMSRAPRGLRDGLPQKVLEYCLISARIVVFETSSCAKAGGCWGKLLRMTFCSRV